MSQSPTKTTAPPIPDARTLEPVIGLEVHAQVLTRSKMFCRCGADYAGAPPNSRVCPVCGGMPGALPVINKRAVESTVATALTLHCDVLTNSKFDRKNYPYPDLPKGYQITQYDRPIGLGGSMEFEVDGQLTQCGIVRVHLEEDTGKTIHTTVDGREASLVDYNRSGVPLMEIVSEPELRSPAAARAYFAALRRMLMYLGVNDGNLQEGSLRADVNVSLRTSTGEFGTKVEIKNLNSFRAVERALEYEIERQRTVLSQGDQLTQETRGWSERDEITLPQRTKEYAHDYRYFPEPDLPPIRLDPEYVEQVRAALPEMPAVRRERLQREFGLTAYTADVLTEEKSLADYFEAVCRAARRVPATEVANWVTGEMLRLLKETGGRIGESVLAPQSLAELLGMVHAGTISGTAAKDVLEEVFTTGESPQAAARRMDKIQIEDESELERLVDEVLTANPAVVEDFRNGKTNAIQALMGKVMKASKGKANPPKVRALLEARINSG